MFLTNIDDADPAKQALAEWRMIVGHCAGCRLTVASDRLVALSAVAQDVQLLLRERGLESRYYAGIWRYEMPHGLLWYTLSGESTSKPGKGEYRAPSWSWASLDMKVMATSGAGSTPVVTFVDAVMSLVDKDDEVGQLSGGYLQMRGKLFKATLDAATDDELEMNQRWRYITKLDHPGGGGQVIRLTDEFWWNYVNFDANGDIRDEFLVLPIGVEWRENPREKCWVVKSLALDLVPDKDGRLKTLGYAELDMAQREELDGILGATEERLVELA
jgi:hypothetical protein